MAARAIKVWNASSNQWEDVAVAAPDTSGLDAALAAHASDTTSVHGIADTSALVVGSGISNIVALTQAAYDALTPSATTLYVITD